MRVYVDVYLAKNLGDDLFIHILAKRFPNMEFVVNYYGNEYDEFFSNYNNLNRSEYPIKYRILNRIKIYDYINDVKRLSKEYDALLFLGGSIFRQENYWKELYELRKKMLHAFKSKGKPVFVLGANFGPFYSNDFLECYRSFFAECDDVCFREKYSKQLFNNCACVRNEADIVFQLKTEKKEKEDQILYSVIEPKHKDGLEKYREKYIYTISESIKYNVRENFKCTLISFCKREGDLEICEEILRNLPQDIRNRVKIRDYDGEIQPVINIISQSKLIIASRFHANVLGLICDTNILPLVYSEKTSNVLEEIGINNPIVKIEECEKILDKNLIKEILNCSNRIKIDRNICESAKRQFCIFEKIILGKR